MCARRQGRAGGRGGPASPLPSGPWSLRRSSPRSFSGEPLRETAAWPALGPGALICFHSLQDYVCCRGLDENQRFHSCGGRGALKRGVQERGVGGQYCPREGGQGEFLALRPALGCQGGPWPWQPLPWAVVNTGFQRGPCSLWEPFSASLLGLFKPGEEREGTGQACCEEMSLRVPLLSPAPGMFPGGPSFQSFCFWSMKRSLSIRNAFSL